MAIRIRGNSDAETASIAKALGEYEALHPQATIDLYRQNSVSIRIRVVDPSFRGMTMRERSSRVWSCLRALPEDVQADVSSVVTVAPEEQAKSLSNLEFEQPTSSLL